MDINIIPMQAAVACHRGSP